MIDEKSDTRVGIEAMASRLKRESYLIKLGLWAEKHGVPALKRAEESLRHKPADIGDLGTRPLIDAALTALPKDEG